MKERLRPIWQVFLAMVLLLSLGLVIAVQTATPVLAATITTTGSGNWNSATNNTPWPGGVIPGATDKVIIAAGHTVTIPQDYNATCGDLNVIGTLSMTGPSGHPAKIRVWGGGTSPVTTGAISGTGTITNSAGSSGGADVEFYGDWSFNGTLSGYVSFYFEGSQDQNTAGGKVAFPRNLFIQKSGGTVYFPVTPTWTSYFHITNAGNGTTDAGTVCYNGGAQSIAVPESTTYHYYNLTLAGSGSKTISTSGIVVDGTLSMEGTATASAAPTYGASATLRYKGSAAQTTGGELLATGVPNLTINNSNGVTLDKSATISGTLTLTSGNVKTGSYTLAIGASGTVSRTSGHIIGNLQKNVATGSGVSRTFEVGTASGYDPVTLNFTSVTVAGNLIANATAGEHPSIGTSAINSSKDVNVYWSFTNSGITFTSYNATFNFIAGDIDGGADATNFIVGKYDADWTYPTIGTKTSTSTQVTGVTSLSDFVLGEIAAPTLIVTFSTNSTFTVPAGVYQITVDAWGGGGGGGGRSSSSPNGGAGGAGGGAYARATINVTPGETYNVTVGGGGAGGSGGNVAGSAGADSYFYKTGGANLTLAKGGLGGSGGASGAGGLGGSAASGVGTYKFSGGNGASGTSSSPYRSGGGGGGAGNQTAGGNASGTTGGTGGNYDGGNGANGRTTDGAGTAGSELGGGGSGACRLSGGGGPYAGGAGASGEVRITYKPAPDAPVLYPENDVQIAFNNIRQNTTTPIFRVSATHTGNFTSFQLELNTAPDFTGTAYRQTFSGNYSPGTQYNLNATGLSPSLPATDGVTYYVRVRASADGGAHWSQWSTVNYPVWTFTYKSTDELPDWFQTTDAQFGTGILSNTATDLPNGRVKLSLVTTTPTWYTADQQTNSGTGTSGSVPKPTNMTAGDLVILVIATQNSPSSSSTGITPPGNFTLIRFEQDTSSTARPEVVAYWKIATGSEPANYTFTVASGNGYWKAIAGRVTGYNSTNPIGNNNGTNSGGTGVTSLAIAGITTSTNNVLLIGAVVARGDSAAPTSFVKPTSMDGLWAMNGSGTGSSGYPGTGGGKEIFATAGGTGTRTFTWTGGSRAAGLMFEILPGEVVAPSGTITSPAIEFGWVTQASNWGEVQVHATTATNNSITVQVLNAVGSPISGKNVTIQNGGSSGSINLTDLSPTGNNATLYLKATLNNNSGGTPYLNDWMLTWAAAAPVPSTITVTAPSAIAFATLVWGDNVKSSVTNGTVTVVFGSDSPTGWQVTAQDVTNGGYMKNVTTPLTNKLQISGNGTGWANADVGITYTGAAAGTYPLPFWVKQVINTNEVVGAYNITIVFTGQMVY